VGTGADLTNGTIRCATKAKHMPIPTGARPECDDPSRVRFADQRIHGMSGALMAGRQGGRWTTIRWRRRRHVNCAKWEDKRWDDASWPMRVDVEMDDADRKLRRSSARGLVPAREEQGGEPHPRILKADPRGVRRAGLWRRPACADTRAPHRSGLGHLLQNYFKDKDESSRTWSAS